ncbi:branched-chain amino acid ABC transporter substrate-binding protein [Stutzerimonas azotifigens]|uniref:branched-chain amino acid ABC transporter substrate-binding protein n=1 Tax=Stutzerimonas azotifigens TaxID=291995 RepID=UPI000424AEC7|nr:branched-chain amino acid ABC transporter substrate-binding protein [Stutzerimonas azotifigens]
MRHALSALAIATGLIAPAIHAEPLKVAIIESLSGSQTSTGRMYSSAARYVLEQMNEQGGYNGEPIQIKDYDNGGNTSGAASQFRQAVADGAHVIIQGSSSAVAGQITEDVRKHNIRNKGNEIVYLNMGGEALELRGDKCHFHAFHLTTTAPMRVGPLVKVMAQEGDLGDRVYSINQAYSWGQDMEQAIKSYADTYDYEVVETVLHEVNRIQDFAPFVAQIQAAKPSSVITGNWSNDLLLLMKAVGDSGLDVTFGTTFLDQVGNVANAGKMALGHYVAHPGNAELNKDPQDAEDYKAFSGHYPVYVEPGTINGIRLFTEALRANDFKGGDIDVNRIALAMEQARLETDIGPVSIRREDHQAIMPVVVSRVEQGVKYPADGTDMGFKPIQVVSPEDAIYPVQESCRMRRPD